MGSADDTGETVICPGCLTREEETAMTEDYMLTAYEIELSSLDPDPPHGSLALTR